MLLILEKAVAIAVGALLPAEHPLLERQLVVGLHALDHILDLHPVGPDILHSGRTRLARDQREILDASPAIRHGVSHHLVPHLGGTHTQKDLGIGLPHAGNPLDARMQHDTIEVIDK